MHKQVMYSHDIQVQTTIDSTTVYGAWFQVDIGQSVLLEYYTIYYINYNDIKSAKLAASTDGSTWTEIYTITNRAHNINTTETYYIPATKYQFYRYYRISSNCYTSGSGPQPLIEK